MAFNRTHVGAPPVASLTDAEIDAELAALEAGGQTTEAGEESTSPRPSAEGAPPSFLDPISQELMRDPVMVESGQVYDRASIVTWLQSSATDPLTGLELSSVELRPVHALRNAIEEWVSMQSEPAAADGGPEAGAASRRRKRRWRPGLTAEEQALAERRPLPVADAPAPSPPGEGEAQRARASRELRLQLARQQRARAQRREERRKTSASYRCRSAASRVAVSRQSVGLTIALIVVGLFLALMEYSNERFPGAGSSAWPLGQCELRDARVECQHFGRPDGTLGFSIDSDRERCRASFTIARLGSGWNASLGDTVEAYRYPSAVFVDTEAEASEFMASVLADASSGAGGAADDAWVNATVPCRCGTLLPTQRCGHCECGMGAAGQCLCPEPQERAGSDYLCGCAGSAEGVWMPCEGGHCQLGPARAVYATAVTGTARLGLLLSSLAVCWAALSCCMHSLALNANDAAAVPQLPAAPTHDDESEAPSSSTSGVHRADLAVVPTATQDDVEVVMDTSEERKQVAPPVPASERQEEQACNAARCCGASALAYVTGLAVLLFVQLGGGRWAWLGIGSAIALGVVLASLAAIGIMARR